MKRFAKGRSIAKHLFLAPSEHSQALHRGSFQKKVDPGPFGTYDAATSWASFGRKLQTGVSIHLDPSFKHLSDRYHQLEHRLGHVSGVAKYKIEA